MPKTTENYSPLYILYEVASLLKGVFQRLDWAEDEIREAMRRHSSERDLLYHSVPLLAATHRLMATEFVYRSHCRELLERLVNDADTRPGTAAEACCLCSDLSLRAPLRSPVAGLCFRIWATAFPGNPLDDDSRQHHEALEGPTIDDIEVIARRKLAVKNRKLGEITCDGRHDGDIVQCKYAGA
ncbi:hypothetical protein [Amycolatopsis cihanbeyliensis]|uniref:Uncharacterized protein n=1 Tax=Amycolatopsis cihanbeyliensis TaxID=1128664 RepID=A0A542DF21_AMYCI|nr:hypothetical protein [Amycolatopsis cihanbeyliensis]TQJ01675.1 hypothetical protein FB471_1380 [Amycolatopsis cihanbeyliensis]